MIQKIVERLRQLAAALPSDTASVTLTRADLVSLLEDDAVPVAIARDLTVEEVAAETGRAASTVRGWMISGALKGYKLNGRDWRVPRTALRVYLEAQSASMDTPVSPDGDVDITAWRRLGAGGS